MKRVAGLVLLVLAFGISGVAAIDTGIGVKGYVGLELASGDDWKEVTNDPGMMNAAAFSFGVGASADYAFSKAFAVGTEVVYGTIKAKAVHTSDDFLMYKIPAIQVPVLLKLAFGTNEKRSTYIYGGPDFFFVMGDGEFVVEIDGEEASLDFETENSFALGVALGMATEYRVGSGALVVDVRYARTLGELLDGAVYFNSLQIGLGYKFLFGK